MGIAVSTCHAMTKAMVRVRLLRIGRALQLGRKFVSSLDVKSKAALNCRVCVDRVSLSPKIALLQRRGGLGEWRS